MTLQAKVLGTRNITFEHLWGTGGYEGDFPEEYI